LRLTDVAALLVAGQPVEFRPSGHSMEPLIKHRQLVRIEPLADEVVLERGEIVFAKVGGHYYLHKIGAVAGDQFRIENNKGHVNGWVTRRGILGRLIR
jgi:hypothetical protein